MTAVMAVARTVRSSLGPLAMNKMMIDQFGRIMVTNDGATILRQLDAQHPAARLLIQLASAQETAVGDGTTTVVILTAQLINELHSLAAQGWHLTPIVRTLQDSLGTVLAMATELSQPATEASMTILLHTSLSRLGSSAGTLCDLVQGCIEQCAPHATSLPSFRGLVRVCKSLAHSTEQSQFIRGLPLTCCSLHGRWVQLCSQPVRVLLLKHFTIRSADECCQFASVCGSHMPLVIFVQTSSAAAPLASAAAAVSARTGQLVLVAEGISEAELDCMALQCRTTLLNSPADLQHSSQAKRTHPHFCPCSTSQSKQPQRSQMNQRCSTGQPRLVSAASSVASC